MTDPTPHDPRTDAVAKRLRDELVDSDGNAPEPDVVDSAVLAAADDFADAPLQEFVPLLIEHVARDELRERGLHREFDTDDDGPPLRSDTPSTNAPTIKPPA